MHQFYLYAYPDRDPSQLESRYMSCLPHHRNDINLHLAPSARGEPSRWRGILSDAAYRVGTLTQVEGCGGNAESPTQLHRLRDGRTSGVHQGGALSILAEPSGETGKKETVAKLDNCVELELAA